MPEGEVGDSVERKAVLGVWPVAVITRSAGMVWPEARVTVVGSRGKPLGGMTAREPVTSLRV